VLDRVATVTLPTQMPVSFPDECVGCGRPSPGRAALLVSRDARYHVALWLGWRNYRVPACRSCAGWLHVWRFWVFSRTLLVAVAGIGFGVIVLLPRLPGFATGIIVLSMIGVAFLTLFAVDRRFPPAFNVDRRGWAIDYEFRNHLYAERFAALNGAVPEQAA